MKKNQSNEINMSMMRRVVLEIMMILSAIYLTFIIDIYTLNTYLKRIFVFCYFLLMCHVAQ